MEMRIERAVSGVLQMAEEDYGKIFEDPETNDSEKAMGFLLQRAVSCLAFGFELVSEFSGRDSGNSDIRKVSMAIEQGQIVWETVIPEIAKRFSVEFHPVSFLMALAFIASSEEIRNEPLAAILPGAISEYLERNPEKFETPGAANIASDAEILGDEDKAKLIPEYFSLLEKIGTFRRNRDAYETEEERSLHDRILEIYRAISR